jgi:hypothetical protein
LYTNERSQHATSSRSRFCICLFQCTKNDFQLSLTQSISCSSELPSNQNLKTTCCVVNKNLKSWDSCIIKQKNKQCFILFHPISHHVVQCSLKFKNLSKPRLVCFMKTFIYASFFENPVGVSRILTLAECLALRMKIYKLFSCT